MARTACLVVIQCLQKVIIPCQNPYLLPHYTLEIKQTLIDLFPAVFTHDNPQHQIENNKNYSEQLK